ncbi:MAG: hypothetical protein EBR28_14320, partial [Planctomycetia bacterium]|nr:hypothetical protein [Planctomycetia bacterium]
RRDDLVGNQEVTLIFILHASHVFIIQSAQRLSRGAAANTARYHSENNANLFMPITAFEVEE